MRKYFLITMCVIVTTLLYGCGAKDKKTSTETISSASQNSDIEAQGQEKIAVIGSDATSSGTVSSISNNLSVIKKEKSFECDYIAKPVNILEDDWLANFAGGRRNTIRIGIGQVIYNDNVENAETYIELENKSDKITLIANGAHYEYDNITNKIKSQTINFITGKRLEKNEVVKDYSDGKIEITLIIYFNENGIAEPSVIFCSRYGGETIPKNNYYKLEVE